MRLNCKVGTRRRIAPSQEEALDKILKPFMEDSRMNMMFDFSNMEASKIQDDIQ
jgi:hypothetical protein